MDDIVYRKGLPNNFFILLAQIIVCLVGYCLASFFDYRLFLFLLGLWNIVFISIILLREEKTDKAMSSPIVFYLLKSIITLGLCNMYTPSEGYVFCGLIISSNDLPYGALIITFGETIFLAGYYICEYWMKDSFPKESYSKISFNESAYKKTILFVIVAFFPLFLIRLYLEVSFGQIINGFLRYYFLIVSSMILSWIFFYPSSIFKRVLCLIILALAHVFYFTRNNSKEELIIITLPYVSFFFQKYRFSLKKIFSTKYLILFLSIASYILFFVYPFIANKRIFMNNDIELSHRDSLTFSAAENEKLGMSNMFDSFINRNNFSVPSAFAYREVKNDGTIGLVFLKEGFYALIPSIFWKDKPTIHLGQTMDSYIRYGILDNSSSSSTCLGHPGNLYIQGGIFYLIFGCFTFGLLVSFFSYRTTVWWYNPISLLIYYSISTQCVRLFESVFDLGSFFVILFVELIIAHFINKKIRNDIQLCQA